jgi:hypothetical protein
MKLSGLTFYFTHNLLFETYVLCHTHICCLELTFYVTHNLLFETYLLCHTHICCLELTFYVTHISAVWNLPFMSHTICCLKLTFYVTHNLLSGTYLLCHTHICCLKLTFYVTHISAVWSLLVILSIPGLGNGGLFTYEVVGCLNLQPITRHDPVTDTHMGLRLRF